jgi:hypothetical protein
MAEVRIYLKGWRDSQLYADAVNDKNHARHREAWAVHARSFLPYLPGDAVYRAITYEAFGDDLTICDVAFSRFNVGDDEIANMYRNHGHRSLSVGDVITIDGNAYTVAPLGFEQVPNFTPPTSTE